MQCRKKVGFIGLGDMGRGMANKDITTVTGLVEFLKREGELFITPREVDPICQVHCRE